MSMFLPYLKEVERSREIVQDIKGLNQNLRIQNNQFRAMKNMSSDNYPVLSVRKKRSVVRTLTKPNGLYAKDALAWVDGTDFYYDGVKRGEVTDSVKQIVAMGAQLLIWPDKMCYNIETEEFSALEKSNVTSGEVKFTLCKDDGTAYENITTSDTAPTASDGKLWIDTSGDTDILKQYSSSQRMWVAIPTTYIKIAATGIGAGMSEYDGVEISGASVEALNGTFVLYGAGDDYLIVMGIIDKVTTQTDAVTVTRKIPDMDYICESENRIWGCSSEKHEIYACKLGDPKNWNSFLGLSSDSYSLVVGSAGEFTGICAYQGYLLFFKEDIIHRLQGSKPSNYQLNTINGRGVQRNSFRSLCIVDETLFYKGRDDVLTYSASMPESISTELGTAYRKNAAAGAANNKYYLSMEEEDGEWGMYVYDTEKNMWHKEDDTHALAFAQLDGDLYWINADTNELCCTDTSIGTPENTVEWMVETGDIGIEMPDNKHISKIQLRMDLEMGSFVKVEVQYNTNESYWKEIYRTSLPRKRSFTLPIIPMRCDTMRIRISGKGHCDIYSISRYIEGGTEL